MSRALWRVLAGAALCSVVIGAQDTLPSAQAVLGELKSGNAHHVAKRYQHPHQTADRQRELASAQHPHAIVLSCADSRVAPEIIFDQGLGDLFDVRVAGNVAGAVGHGALTVVGAVYSLDSGKVAGSTDPR
jgi:carbonic anhydrase